MVEGVGLVRSKYEARVAADLLERGIHPHYEEVRLPYEVPRIYVADFAPRTPSGRQVIIEAKGYFPLEDRRKVLEMVRANPAIDFRLLFQKASTKVRRGAKLTYAGWADKHGIPWAEGLVPDAWLED